MKISRFVAFLSAVMLAWSQIAISAYACPQDMLASIASMAAKTDMPVDCAKQMDDNPTPLCKAHCDQSSQSSQTPTMFVPAIALIELWPQTTLGSMEPMLPTRFAQAAPNKLAGASPPLRIQYQVFRN